MRGTAFARMRTAKFDQGEIHEKLSSEGRPAMLVLRLEGASSHHGLIPLVVIVRVQSQPSCHFLRLLLVNSASLYSLQAGGRSGGDRYYLHRLPLAGIPNGAELVACDVIPARISKVRSDDVKGSESTCSEPGIVCLAMLTRPGTSFADDPPKEPQAGDQGISTGRPNVTGFHSSAAPILGTLNVYPLEWDTDVSAAVQREPQQIPLPYAPIGVAHVALQRSTESQPVKNPPDGGTERGEAVLVWASDGFVHVYTRWHGPVPGAEGKNSSKLLKEESAEALEELLPELKEIRSPVLSLQTDVTLSGAGTLRRTIIAGCTDGIRLLSTNVANGRVRAASSNVHGRVTAVGVHSWYHDLESGTHEERVGGFACSDRGSVASLTLEVGGAREPSPRGWTGAVPLADGANVLSIGYADFCRDGSASVAVGTSSGTITVFDSSLERSRRQHVLADNVDRSFGIPWNPAAQLAEHYGVRPSDQSSTLCQLGPEWQRGTRKSSPHPRVKYMEAKWQTHVPYPVWGITVGDFNHDGVSEMVAATMHAVHVFRPDYREEASRLQNILNALERLRVTEEDSSAPDDEPVASDHLMGLEFIRGCADASAKQLHEPRQEPRQD